MTNLGWKTQPVRSLIASHMSGPSPTCEERQVSHGSEWGLLKTTAVSWKGWNPDAHKVPPSNYWHNTKIQTKQGDVLITKAGPRARVGVIVYVDQIALNLMVSGKMIGLRPDKDVIDGRVLAALLSAEQYQRYLNVRTTGMAESQLNFTNEVLLDMEVDVPPISWQRKFVALDTVMNEQVKVSEALVSKYQQIKEGLMRDLFTRGITSDGQFRPHFDELPEQYQDTSVGIIPKDWSIRSLDELTTKIVDGVHHTPNYVEHGVPFVTVKNLTRSESIDFGDLNYIDDKTHSECFARADPKPGDVLVTKDGTLGCCRIVKEGMPEFSIFVSVALLRVASDLTSEWLHFFFESGLYLKQLGYLSAGSGLQHIHLEHFRKFQIPLPCVEEQRRLVEKVSIISELLRQERRALEKLKLKNQGLMHDLIVGRVALSH